MLLNAGVFHNEMTKLGAARMMPIFGSSANTSLSGSKYTLATIEQPVRDAADILVDGGLCKYHNPEGRSSTIIDFRTFKTVRVGVVYDKLCEIFLKFKIDLRAIGMAA
jgi:tRNA A37 threonylcarbamoyladenosine synthetase subunit TsaC/SUA5/YrdC